MTGPRRTRAALVFAATSLALMVPALHGITAHAGAVGGERSATGELSGARALGAAQREICGVCLSASQLRSKLAALDTSAANPSVGLISPSASI
jgi:hypothetical protein